MTLLLLLACVETKAPSDDDSASTDSTPSDDSGDTAPAPCDEPDPGGAKDFWALAGRLDAQHCLSPSDQEAMSHEMDRFHEEARVWCDQVYRLRSVDGLAFTGEPELVRTHASVADVMITPEGTHVVVYNDLAPTLLMDTLVQDPERFWRQGLLGLGGIGMIVDEGSGFVDAAFDAHLASLQEVIDPDLSVLADGTFRFVWFAVPVGNLSRDDWDPLVSHKPHAFFRTTSPDLASFPTAPPIVSSSEGEYGEADPSVVSLSNGGEVLYAGAWDGTAKGWISADGETWDDGAAPDIDSQLPAAAPDVVHDGVGGYRMYFVNTETAREDVATSVDGQRWTLLGPVMDVPDANGGAVAQAPDGTWWIYFNLPDKECKAG